MDAVIVSSVCRFATLEKAEEVNQYFSEHPIPSSARRISQTVESMRVNGALLERVRNSDLNKDTYWH